MSEPIPFPAELIPEDLKKTLKAEEEPNHIVPKRSAKTVAERLTERPCTVYEHEGCFIRVEYAHGRSLSFRGATWWLALRALNHHLTIKAAGAKAKNEIPREADKLP